MIPYSLFDKDGYVQQEGYCPTVDNVHDVANMLGLRIFWGLTESKYIDPVTEREAYRPRPPLEVPNG